MYAIACSKIWDKDFISKMEKKTGEKLFFITAKEELTAENLKEHKITTIFFPHWSYIIKSEIFDNFECVIFHMTDLPYGRGGSPLQNLIVRGHKKTKISALLCQEGVDTGPVFMKSDLDLSGTATEIFERATAIIQDMIAELMTKKPVAVGQKGDVVEFKRRTPAESNISDINDVEKAYDFIRMLDAEGYPKAFLETDTLRFEFTGANLNNNELEAKVRIIKK